VFTFVILVLVPRFRPRGILGGRVSAANWRGGMRPPAPPAFRLPHVSRASKLANPLRLRHLVVLAFLIAYPGHDAVFTYQIGAQALRWVIALSLHVPRRLRRHDLARADDGGRHRGLHGGDLRHRGHRRREPGWPWWLAW